MKPNKHMLFVSFDEIDGVCANFNFDLCINSNKVDDKLANAVAASLLKTEVMENDYYDSNPEYHLYDSIEEYNAQLCETLKQLGYEK